MASRQLLCRRCDALRQTANIREDPGSHWRYVRGTLAKDKPGPLELVVEGKVTESIQLAACACDVCNAEMPLGSPACCATFWRYPEQEPGSWESADGYLTNIDPLRLQRVDY
jgi:hypothetical protein